MATASDAPTPELTFHPSRARRIWRIAQPALWERRHAACPHPELCDPAVAHVDGSPARSEPG